MDRGSVGSGIGREESKEEASRFGASREGVELGRDLCHEFRNHLGRL